MDPPPDVEELLAPALKGDVSKQIAVLEALRLGRLVHPDLALKFGANVLSTSRGKRLCGNDLWAVYEQVLIAALYLDQEKWYEHCRQVLGARFPQSMRVKRLDGIMYEKKGSWAQAEKVYTEILTEKPSDTATRKRLIAILKGQKKISEAVEECNAYLELFQTDQEVWHELGELHLSESNLTKAGYCFVELLLSNPRNTYAVITYAELQYSLGDLELARKYFCLAAHLDESNLRAMWGLVMCLHAVGTKRDEKLNQLHSITKKKLKDLYAAKKQLSAPTRKAAITFLETL